MTPALCHCGKDGHTLGSINCPVHGYVCAPREPTEAMWGGLARDLVLWQRFKNPTGRALYEHLIMLGRTIPDWLTKEIGDLDHVPPKGTVATCIYKAMIEAVPNG